MKEPCKAPQNCWKAQNFHNTGRAERGRMPNGHRNAGHILIHRGKEQEFYVETHLTDAHDSNSTGTTGCAHSDQFDHTGACDGAAPRGGHLGRPGHDWKVTGH